MSSLNIIKKYPELLELAYLSEREREHDLHAIFKRDIEDNCQFSFRGWRIYPIKTDGEIGKSSVRCPLKPKRFYPLKIFNNAPSKSLDRWGYYYFSLFPSVCRHLPDTFSV